MYILEKFDDGSRESTQLSYSKTMERPIVFFDDWHQIYAVDNVLWLKDMRT